MRESRQDGQGATRRLGVLRRLGGRGESLPRSDSERIAAVAAEAHVPVEEVLRDVADFRLALETDMIIAAAAVDAESPETLSDVLDDERLELATFHDRLLTRLADAAAEDELALRRDRKRPATGGWTTRLAAAGVAAAAVLGGTQMSAIVGRPDTVRTAADSAALQAADQRYTDLSPAVSGDSSPTAVRAAANELHKTLETLIAEHADDPAVAERTARLLQWEIALLELSDTDGASQVLAQARTLVKMLKQAAPAQVRVSVAPALDGADSPRPAKPKSASPTPKATASATPSPTASASASSSSDPDDAGPLDTP